MRSETEILRLICSVAERDERIRAALLSGSRVRSGVTKDDFQDYDVIYVVRDLEPFVKDRAWLDVFGRRIIQQTPDDSVLFPKSQSRGRFAFLMLFTDGSRIDLTLVHTRELGTFRPESATVCLLDKDGIFSLPPPSEQDYVVRRPSAGEFAGCCNEFWWVSTYVAKGLFRGELPYAHRLLEDPVRAALTLMLTWHVGFEANWTVNCGLFGKYLQRLLPEALWRAYMQTLPGTDPAGHWRALFACTALFREIAQPLSTKLGCRYPSEDDVRVSRYLRHVRDLATAAPRG